MVLWNDLHMPRCSWVNIEKRKKGIILVDYLRGDFLVDYLAKNTVFIFYHTCSVYGRIRTMQSTELLESLLKLRGIADSDRDQFLSPSYEKHLHDPFLMKDMEKAVDRILSAVKNDEHIVIYSDYDADGIPGGVILHDFFKKIGYGNFENYIPHRHDEGYGLHMDAVKQFVEANAKLVITVDLGITAIEEVAYAQSHGMDVIITDHHLPHEHIPEAFAILNPKQKGDTYPFKELCGAGVAFKLVQGLLKKLRAATVADDLPAELTRKDELKQSSAATSATVAVSSNVLFPSIQIPDVGWEKWLLDMAGLATLSDMVPLVGENRVLSYYGMMVLQKTRRAGLQHLFKKMKIDPRHLSEDDITFMLTPRLNAASRMDSPQRAFEVLSETDEGKAGAVAEHLIKINDSRKTIVATIMKDVHKKLEKRELKDVVVIGDPKWRIGVLGLVASKITETYNRPSFVWGVEGAEEGEMIKGSCRSEGSVNVVTLMTEATEAFHSFGGHELAGGFVVTREKVHFLEDALVKAFAVAKQDKKVVQEKKYDLAISVADITRHNYEQLAKLAPFGMANEKPIFLLENVTVENVKLFGKEKEHLELVLFDGRKSVKAIAFFKTEKDFDVVPIQGATVNVSASMEMSYFMGRPELRLRIVAIN